MLLSMTSRRLLELGTTLLEPIPVSSRSPVVAGGFSAPVGCDGPESKSRRFTSPAGSSSFFFFSSSLSSSSFWVAEIPVNNAFFNFSFLSSTLGFAASFFWFDVLPALEDKPVVAEAEESFTGAFEATSSVLSMLLPQTCLALTLSCKLAFASAELYEALTVTGAKPEVLSTGLDPATSLVR